MSDNDSKVFRVWLPLFRVGDDFQSCYEHNNHNAPEAFRALANAYTEAASMCKRVAGVLKENPGYTAQGDAHMLWVEGPLMAMEPLIREGIVAIEEFEEYNSDEAETEYIDSDLNDGLDNFCTTNDERIMSVLCSGTFVAADWPEDPSKDGS